MMCDSDCSQYITPVRPIISNFTKRSSSNNSDLNCIQKVMMLT